MLITLYIVSLYFRIYVLTSGFVEARYALTLALHDLVNISQSD